MCSFIKWVQRSFLTQIRILSLITEPHARNFLENQAVGGGRRTLASACTALSGPLDTSLQATWVLPWNLSVPCINARKQVQQKIRRQTELSGTPKASLHSGCRGRRIRSQSEVILASLRPAWVTRDHLKQNKRNQLKIGRKKSQRKLTPPQ